MGTPFFSVLIPSYNRPEFIVKAVESVLKNTYTDFELLISDDKSPRRDEIIYNLQPYLADPRVKFFSQENNLREPANRAFLIDKASAKWVIFLCDDDLLMPNALETIYDYIQHNSNSHVFNFGYNYIDQHELVKYERYSPKTFDLDISNIKLVKEFLCCDIFPYWFYSPVTFCFNKEATRNIKPNYSIGIGDDLMYLMDVVLSGLRITVIPKVLMSYRRFDAVGTNYQPNQTAGILPNLISRALILRNLCLRNDIEPAIERFIKSYPFRKTFVYLQVVQSKLPFEEIKQSINLNESEFAELKLYYHKQSIIDRLKIKAWRVIKFSSITGMKGFLHALKLSLKPNFKL